MKKLQAIVLGLTLAIALGYIFFFVPPNSESIVALFIIVLGISIYYISSFFLKKKYRFLPALGIVLFLGMNFLVGFQIVNTILLISFIIGLYILVR